MVTDQPQPHTSVLTSSVSHTASDEMWETGNEATVGVIIGYIMQNTETS